MSTAATNPPEPTQAEVDALSQVLYEAWEAGIRFGTGSLARHILAAGYRPPPEPEPTRYGVCRKCEGTHPLTEAGTLIEHDDPHRPGQQCLCSRVMPERIVDPAEVVAGGG